MHFVLLKDQQGAKSLTRVKENNAFHFIHYIYIYLLNISFIWGGRDSPNWTNFGEGLLQTTHLLSCNIVK